MVLLVLGAQVELLEMLVLQELLVALDSLVLPELLEQMVLVVPAA